VKVITFILHIRLPILTWFNARLLGSCFKTSKSFPLWYPPIPPSWIP